MTDSEAKPNPRRAGILLHPTSLPGRFGIGDLGPEAFNFLEFMANAGQRLWQILPLTPAGAGNSPYAARSTFAANPLLISPDALRDQGLIEDAERDAATLAEGERIDFAAVKASKERVLRHAFVRFCGRAAPEAFLAFREHARGWLPDYALFMALRRAFGGGSWVEWPEEIRRRDEDKLDAARRDLAGEIAFTEFKQWCAFDQWAAVKRFATERGIAILGDIPIFVDHDSADAWANQRIFKLCPDGRPAVVAGVPPDVFAATGQRWGNPVYRWDVLRGERYAWWRERLHATLELVDIVRLDHFRGFQAAWEIPANEPTAEHGHWVEGPGRELFDDVRADLGPLPVVAEDLGLITPEVRQLCDGLGYPGMKVLQFAFGDDHKNPYLPHNLTERSVIYTGTHDNDTTAGWLATASEHEQENMRRYLGKPEVATSDLVRLAYAAVAETAIVPMQDVLELGSEARMNVPGRPDGNWGWRFRWEQLDSSRPAWLRELAETYGRLAD
ncbi:MAG: 4-alpha-glucanotransferase [Chloroflexi bacterium]|nr:4-alpha-glucanotransferase [Chloroflexota bacterium]